MRKLYLGLSFVAMVVLMACDGGSGTEVNSDLPPNFSNSSPELGNEYGSSSSNENVAIVDPSTVVTGTMTDDRDGQTYRTVKIGDQTWMAENLNYRYLGPTTELDSSSFCYDDAPAYCDTYGRLYLWSAAMDSAGIIKGNTANGCGGYSECTLSGNVRGVCPQGWHVPSNEEWKALIVAVEGFITDYFEITAGPKLKSASGWYENGTDNYGFSGFPAGMRYHDGDYEEEGGNANFWSSTEGGSFVAYFMELSSLSNDANMINVYKGNGFSVRCLKD